MCRARISKHSWLVLRGFGVVAAGLLLSSGEGCPEAARSGEEAEQWRPGGLGGACRSAPCAELSSALAAVALAGHCSMSGSPASSRSPATPAPAWKIRQAKPATIAEIDKLPDHHTTAETAAILQGRGLANGEGRPYNLTMVQRVIRTYHLRSRRQRLLDAGLIPLSQMRNLSEVARWPRSIRKLRAACVVHTPSGFGSSGGGRITSTCHTPCGHEVSLEY